MTQRIRDGLGLPAGIYRINKGGAPTVFVPNGITADGVESIVMANVIAVGDGYDVVIYDDNSDVFAPAGSPAPSPTQFNGEVAEMFADILGGIYIDAHPEGEIPYAVEPSESRANIIDDLATMKADFFINQ